MLSKEDLQILIRHLKGILRLLEKKLEDMSSASK